MVFIKTGGGNSDGLLMVNAVAYPWSLTEGCTQFYLTEKSGHLNIETSYVDLSSWIEVTKLERSNQMPDILRQYDVHYDSVEKVIYVHEKETGKFVQALTKAQN